MTFIKITVDLVNLRWTYKIDKGKIYALNNAAYHKHRALKNAALIFYSAYL